MVEITGHVHFPIHIQTYRSQYMI